MTKINDKPNIVFMGTPAFAAGILSWLVGQGYPVSGVVTVPDKPAGRGQELRPSEVKKTALALGIPVLQPVMLKDPSFLENLSRWNVPIFVVVAFRILPRQVWQLPTHGCFNLHASLLPMYRGAAPINHAIINGETETGLTTFLIDDHMDTGGILLQEHITISDTDNAGSLHDRMMLRGGPLVARTINGLWSGSLKAFPQQPVAWENLKTAPKISKKICRIDWDREPGTIVNLIRGLSPYPCAYSTLRNGDISADMKIFKAKAEHARHGHAPGSIFTDKKKTLKVACREGFVHILEIQAPGKKQLSIETFLAGFRKTEPISFS